MYGGKYPLSIEIVKSGQVMALDVHLQEDLNVTTTWRQCPGLRSRDHRGPHPLPHRTSRSSPTPKKVRLLIIYPQTAGRNFDEILRVIDSLQLTDAHRAATPVNWKQGEDVIIVPAISDAEAKEKFPNGWKALTAYLRLTKQPAGR